MLSFLIPSLARDEARTMLVPNRRKYERGYSAARAIFESGRPMLNTLSTTV
jgi:hypothetical protein